MPCCATVYCGVSAASPQDVSKRPMMTNHAGLLDHVDAERIEEDTTGWSWWSVVLVVMIRAGRVCAVSARRL